MVSARVKVLNPSVARYGVWRDMVFGHIGSESPATDGAGYGPQGTLVRNRDGGRQILSEFSKSGYLLINGEKQSKLGQNSVVLSFYVRQK